ncbi:MAG: M14 family zinc carboxypeptidase [Candidatus Accumulibacter sp.]|uniref:M14 family zinc carboxypeptidase n=1 Tax=Accumulibacter sp. TaxID=2053492 RepID=UPI0028786B72|nr:M14 family zinc carboxypeptidase [Accumulibacter sp.]MDS4015445.1 M14 family zinc carboxypeptidase [Accumulibacter sp.]
MAVRDELGLSELAELEGILDQGGSYMECRELAQVDIGGRCFPVLAITLGNPDPGVPAAAFFGGVHGLERIGTAVVLSYLRNLASRLRWDRLLHFKLESVRLVFLPVVNPGGMWRGTRANPAGVDLMRNAPVDAEERPPFLLGGHRFGARLPWYRGAAGAAMEIEAAALCRIVEEEMLTRDFSIALDCHSGFGILDRIWFPYACTRRPIRDIAEVHALSEIFDQMHPCHRYVFEPQSRQYLAHGDLWDFLYRRAEAVPEKLFLPLTLEMGSWMWVKKNPRQVFSRYGIFNPLIEHRQQRVLRRHFAWFDFIVRAAASHRHWRPEGETLRQHQELALQRWYRNKPS